jgi:hypothetical protein
VLTDESLAPQSNYPRRRVREVRLNAQFGAELIVSQAVPEVLQAAAAPGLEDSGHRSWRSSQFDKYAFHSLYSSLTNSGHHDAWQRI